MSGRRTAHYLTRLARLEAAAAGLVPPPARTILPEKRVLMCKVLSAGFHRPGAMPLCSHPLRKAFAACCQVFPERRDVDVSDPPIASLIADLRAELAAFLRSPLAVDGHWWNTSYARSVMAEWGCGNGPAQGQPRGPCPEAWCASLSDLEVLFDAYECLVLVLTRVEQWWRRRCHGADSAREEAGLSAEEEAALLAEWGQEGLPQDLRSLLMEAPASPRPGATGSP